MLPGMRIGSSSQFWLGPRTSPGEMFTSLVRLASIQGWIPQHPDCISGEHCFRGDYDCFRLIIGYSQLQHFAEFFPHGPGLISIPAKVGVALAVGEMEYRLDVAGDKLATKPRPLHDIHHPEEARQVAHFWKRGTFVICLGYSEPCHVAPQESSSLPRQE